MRNSISITLVYAQMVYDLPMWLTSPILAMVTYWCSLHWSEHSVIWTPGTTSWVGVTLIFLCATVAKPVLKFLDQQDHEAFEAHEAYELAS